MTKFYLYAGSYVACEDMISKKVIWRTITVLENKVCAPKSMPNKKSYSLAKLTCRLKVLVEILLLLEWNRIRVV